MRKKIAVCALAVIAIMGIYFIPFNKDRAGRAESSAPILSRDVAALPHSAQGKQESSEGGFVKTVALIGAVSDSHDVYRLCRALLAAVKSRVAPRALALARLAARAIARSRKALRIAVGAIAATMALARRKKKAARAG